MTEGPGYEKHWKRYLILIWLCQFLFQCSFSFGIPFAPLFIQSLGVPQEQLPFYVACFGAGPALTTLLFSPFWGAMADRFGRKKMLLRCYIGGVAVLSGIGLCTKPEWMIVFRLLQGVVCGSIPAALALVSSQAPKERTGFALGAVNSATFSGMLIGALFGGIAADQIGFRNAFLVSGAPSLIAALLMALGVRENFKPAVLRAGSAFMDKLKTMAPTHRQLIIIAPLLAIMGGVMYGRQFDNSFMPLFVQQIHGAVHGSATWTGIIQALSGIAGVAAGLLSGYFSDRAEPGKMALCTTLIAAVLLSSLYFTPCLSFLLIMRTAANLAVDGIEPALQAWLCRKTPLSGRNIAFAWAASVRSAGWFFSPLSAGFVVHRLGIRALFPADGIIFLLLALCIFLLWRKDSRHRIRDERT